MYICINRWMKPELHECMYISKYICTYMYTDTYIHVYRMQFPEIFLSNKIYINDYRCETTNMAAK